MLRSGIFEGDLRYRVSLHPVPKRLHTVTRGQGMRSGLSLRLSSTGEKKLPVIQAIRTLRGAWCLSPWASFLLHQNSEHTTYLGWTRGRGSKNRAGNAGRSPLMCFPCLLGPESLSSSPHTGGEPWPFTSLEPLPSTVAPSLELPAWVHRVTGHPRPCRCKGALRRRARWPPGPATFSTLVAHS